MTIHFTNDEMKYIESYGDDLKMRCKKDTPEEVKKQIEGKIKDFNKWIDEINGKDVDG